MPKIQRPAAPDVAFAAAGAAISALLAVTVSNGRGLDLLGWSLLLPCAVLLAWRRLHPLGVLILLIAVSSMYHGQDYNHLAVVPISMVALYTVAAAGPRRRTLVMTAFVVAVAVAVMFGSDQQERLEMLRTSGWVLLVVVAGEASRLHRDYVAAIVERAERAERSREEEAARRVAEERLRIARDLHDLLAHSITLIGVQTSVAAHVLIAEPDRLDRAALAQALDSISATCRDARSELRATLMVLRSSDPDGHEPLPGLSGLPNLVRTAEAGGAAVELTVAADAASPPPAVGAAAYRIVQQSLTNTVQHAGAGVRVAVDVRPTADGSALQVRVTDTGPAEDAPRNGTDRPATTPSFGIAGMRERARSVGGALAAGPRGPGFEVSATLPLAVPDPVPRRAAEELRP